MIKKFILEFKEFVSESDFITVAIGFLVATGIKDLMTSLFTNIITPILNSGLINLGVNISDTSNISVFGISLGITPFFSSVISFFMLLFITFILMKSYTKFIQGKEKIDGSSKSETDLLEEILIELKNK